MAKNKENDFPYSNEVKKMKDTFKNEIDRMSDNEFLNFYFALLDLCVDFDDEDYDEDDDLAYEDWEDDIKNFYDLKFNFDDSDVDSDEDMPF